MDETVDALGLAAAIAGEMQRIADDDACTAVTSREAENGALVAAGLRALNGEERLGDAENARECDTDAARADVKTEPGVGLTGKWHTQHALMIVSEADGGDYNR